MFGAIARFELGYQLRNPVFWVVSILFFLLTFGSVTVEQIQIGSGGNIHKNAPVAIAQTTLIMSLFFMFVTTAFVANVIVRDDESGFGPMVRSTRVKKFDYLLARFLGAFGAAAIAFAAVPLAIFLGSLMPWIDGETLGPNRLADYAYAYFLLALPDLFLTAAIFFAVATMTRSMTYSYMGVVVFLVLYFVINGVVGSNPELRQTAALFEPFGIAAFGEVTRYWTASESNAGMPPFEGALLWNRLLAIGLGLLGLGVAYWRFSFAERGASKRALRRAERREEKLAATQPRVVDRLPPVRPRAAAWARFWARVRFEMRLVFRSPAFLVLLLVGAFNAVGGLLFGGEMFGTPIRPRTFWLIDILLGSFSLIPIIIAIYYAGELVWRDRERRMHEIVDATSLPNWAYMFPKTLAVAGVLFATLLVSVLVALAVQVARGGDDLALGQYFGWYVLPMTVSFVILAVLAVFVQALSPNKYVGWAIMVGYLVASITLTNIGWEHPLYDYGATGQVQLSDMNGDRLGAARAWWLRLYWGAWAIALAVLAHLLWRRGTEARLRRRVGQLPARLASPAGAALAAALLVAAGTGAHLYRDMNVVNEYRTRDDDEARLAAYEKKYLRYENLPQPSLTDVRMNVDLRPAERRMVATGEYRFVNDTGAPLSDIHVRLPDRWTEIAAITVPGARLVSDDRAFKHRIYRFDRPLPAGAGGAIGFRTTRERRGMVANAEDPQLVANGTFLNNFEILPQIGMSRQGLLSDRVKRRSHGLPAELRPARLEDPKGVRRNYIADADWVRSDITVSTDAGQTPIAPGRLVSDVTADGRRTARYVSSAPILAFFSIQSADYARKDAVADGVQLSVFYDRRHPYNVDRMLDAMARSLRYYRENFGPYQFPYARVMEFPGYASFAQAFAGTVPYSERIGFLADASDPEKIDYVSYVTAHEIGHQYWGHQVVGADQQGGTIWVETLAQYSALMVMKQLYGDDKIRRFLKYELDNYLRSRGGEALEELPMERMENQGYIHYRKGSVVMYLLQDRLGEARVNRMLAGLIARHRFRGAPYPRSTELVDGFLSLARTPAERELVIDLLRRITIYDLKASGATTRRLPDGRWETAVDVEAGKAYADGKGAETRARLADEIEVGAFAKRPGAGEFARADVLLLERRPIGSGRQRVRIVTASKPAFAGVDPYNKYVDRNSDDNLVAVTAG
ncbi:ABC transporter permease/M1 family aminopeptidase [Sphingomonas lenta]|uniref:Aminopeptidase n=1 Tax=Sphingomonas lenta TaxID=1141887 RepID=A0A2A2SEK0_9SPHN|nr:M1 family aminopeptidase [Sphingomonas lenta]PAX07612.1 aminopeptidase [Sphingomonas lenta]